MVIPMGGGGGLGQQIRGPVPAECGQAVQRVKVAVVSLVACMLGRIVTATYQGFILRDLMNLLNVLLVVIMGTFVLQEDKHFKAAYDLLATSLCSSCHEQGMGGLGCIMPFALCCGVNFVLDLLFKLGMALDPRAMPYGVFLFGTIVAEGAGAYFGYRMYKVVTDNGLGNTPDMEMGSGGLGGLQGGFLGGGGGGARNYQQPPQQGEAAQPPPAAAAAQAPASGFQPFGGAGQRLGG